MIDPKLIEQWAKAAEDMAFVSASKGGDYSVTRSTALATMAAAHGAEQREKELLAVGMEPLANLHDDGYWTSANTQAGRSVRDSLNHAGAPKLPVYTATQLAAARLQGAEQAKAAMQDVPETNFGNTGVKLEALAKRDISDMEQGSTYFRGLGWNEAIESAQQVVAAERAKADAAWGFYNAAHTALGARITALEDALRQAVDALQEVVAAGGYVPVSVDEAITAGEEALK